LAIVSLPLFALAACEQGSVEVAETTATTEYSRATPAPAPAAGPSGVVTLKAVPEANYTYRPPREGLDREAYQHLEDNPVKRVAEHPVSTFSVDVDTGAYANVRRFLNSGRLPPKDAVRIEELINYFAYDYPVPTSPEVPFSVTAEAARAPWNPETYLLQVGIKGYEVAHEDRPAANLVFLVDVSGSMNATDKLPLLVNALKLLTKQLTAADRVSLVVYAGAAGVVLEPTPGNRKAKILTALDRLRAGGSTAGEAGLKLAYTMAEQGRIDGGINRVLLATDGDFNVGVADVEALKSMIERKRDGGITLTTLGFGTGNYNEALMEQIADVGNGNYAYIDSLNEARKVLVTEMSSTLFTIAKDVKVQIEFNPAVVAEYRLIGYQNRVLAREDFRNDKVDAGDIGAGHTVTALYEIALVGGEGERVDPLRYGAEVGAPEAGGEFAFLKLRYKAPEGDTSKLIQEPLMRSLLEGDGTPSENLRFAAAVAAFGQLLRGGRYTEAFGYEDVVRLARDARGDDGFGYRAGFISLVQLAGSLSGS
jgi:Ca-activated chloride channel family protein